VLPLEQLCVELCVLGTHVLAVSPQVPVPHPGRVLCLFTQQMVVLPLSWQTIITAASGRSLSLRNIETDDTCHSRSSSSSAVAGRDVTGDVQCGSVLFPAAYGTLAHPPAESL
jgi:hypothetical protein